jgi:HEAT repeat protein
MPYRWTVPLCLLLALALGCRKADPPRETAARPGKPKKKIQKESPRPGPKSEETTTPAPQTLEECLEALANGADARARRAAAFALGRMGEDGKPAIAALAQAAEKDGDPSVRDMAAQAIGEIVVATKSPASNWDAAGPTLLRRLRNEDDPRVKRSIVYALGAFGKAASGAAPALMRALSDETPSVRQNAAWALGKLGTGTKELAARLRDDNALVRRDAAQALGEIAKSAGKKEASPAGNELIAMAVNERDGVVRKAALASLANLAGPEHAGSCHKLHKLLEDTDPEARRAAAFALAGAGGEHLKKALPVFKEALADSDSKVQEMAAGALAKIGEAAAPAAEALANALKKADSPLTRRNCAIALGQLKANCPEEGVMALAAALKPKALKPEGPSFKDEEEVRHMAAEALSHIGHPANKAAMPAIRDALVNDRNNEMRLRLVEALFNVDDLDGPGLTKALVTVLDEKTTDKPAVLVRYNCARVLARAKHENAPDRTVGVLMDMLHDREIKVFYETGADVDGGVTESSKGGTSTAARTGGDARFMAAEALAELRTKASGNKKVMDALRKAKADPDPMLKKAATEAVSKLGG